MSENVTAAPPKVGFTINDEDVSAKRDAIHIPVMPVRAQEKLYPGQEISVLAGTDSVYRTTKGGDPAVGIVDPLLAGPVFAGERFWMWVFPNTITSLRHDWTHPVFDVVPPTDWNKEVAKASKESVQIKVETKEELPDFHYTQVDISKSWIKNF